MIENRRQTPTFGALAAGLLVLFTSCSPARRADVVLVTIDTLRPDALGWVGGRNPTPRIDRLAAEGFAFASAVSPAPLTLPAHVSLHTGLNPRRHGVRDNGQVVPSVLPTLAQRFGAAGYRTGAVISGYPLRKMFGLDKGFESYADELSVRPDGRWQDRPAAATTALALEWLRGVKKKDPTQPFFLWVHFYDPHAPYEPPERLIRPGDRGAYDGEVAAVDEAVGQLLAGLDEAFPSRPRLLVLAGDHGESLGEHGEATHGFFVYDSTTLVPLLFHGRELIPRGSSAEPARLIDVAPTILELLGMDPLPETDGSSLGAIFRGERVEIAPALIESRQPFEAYGWAPLTAWRTASLKWIEAPKPELFDLVRDRGERSNLGASDARAEAMQRDLARELRKPPKARAEASSDAEVAAALRSLGYVGGGAPAVTDPGRELADPKDRLHTKELLELAEQSLALGEPTEALALFDLVLASEPENRYALLRGGQTLARAGKLEDATRLFENLLRVDPAQPEARFELADALARSGRTEAALEQWLALAERQPRRAVAWSNAGALLVQRGDLERGEAALTHALELEPENPQFRRNLAECRYRQALQAAIRSDRLAARERLTKALEIAPDLRLRAASDPGLAPLLRQDSPGN